MDTIVRPPDTSGAPTIAPRRRWARVLVSVLVGIVVTLLTLGSAWIANYAPLAPGSLGFSTDRTDVKMIRVDAFDLNGTVFTVPTGRTATFQYRLSILNDGPVAVEIDRIGTPPGEDGVIRKAVRVVPDWANDGGTAPSREEPWRPFTLPPGGEAIIVMEAVYQGRCMQRGDSISWFWEPVSYSVFGLPRNDTIEAGVEVRFTGDGSCGSA